MDEFEVEIKNDFINEGLINLEEAESSFMELESATDPKPLLDKIFRLAHNLKGGARAVGFGSVAEFTHQLENLVSKLKTGDIPLTSDVVTVLLRSNDRLVEMLTELKVNLEASFDNGDLQSEIQSVLEGKTLSVVAEQPSAPVPSAAEFFADEPGLKKEQHEEPIEVPLDAPAEVVSPPQAASLAAGPPSGSAPPASSAANQDEVVRVNLSKIDTLNDYVGELIVLQSVIDQQVQRYVDSGLQSSIRQMVKLSKEIQSISMGLRMLPVKPLVQKLQRVVRDTAKTLGKEVAFEVVGDQMDIDKSVLDRLADPLIHILRNAVDHGLETPEDRQKAGKSLQGAVSLGFRNEGNHLVIEVRDNGKGINSEVLRTKAIEKGILSAASSLSEKQLIHLIFHPGFSTKSVASEISGRGVGMDVVKTNIEKVGGLVDVSTELGKGTSFRLQIPLSLAVIEGLVVTSNRNRYVVPLNQIQETINLKTQRIFNDRPGIGACFELRGSVVPLVGIEEALGVKGEAISDADTGLIVSVEDRPMALVVKDILRSQQIVIKPLGNGIRAQRGWVGSCILGDGLPTLIVSPTDLLEGRILGGVA